MIDWIPSDFDVAYDTPSYLSELTYLDLDAQGSVLIAAPVSLTHGTAVAGLLGESSTAGLRFSSYASSFSGSTTVFDSSPAPAAAPEPTAAILSTVGLASLAAFIRRRR